VLTSVAAGLVTLGFGARVGGILLGFPAIMAASLTLIEEEEHARRGPTAPRRRSRSS